jgi:anti-anti-sigma factor
MAVGFNSFCFGGKLAMEISSRDYKRVSIIRVVGRVDATTAPEFESRLKSYVNGRSHLILELDAADYISSAGLRAMISAQKTLKAKSGQLVLAQVSEKVKEVLQLAGLDPLFPMYPSTEAAIGEA